MSSRTHPLSAEQIATFQRQGFLALDRLVGPEDVASIRASLMGLYANRAGWDKGEQFDLAGSDTDAAPALPQILGPSRFAPELAAGPMKDLCFDLAHQLLGGPRDELGVSCEHAILKPANHGAETPWHQDEAYWRMPDHDARCIAVWMPLQDATRENGCLWYLPGSHLGPIRRHRPIGGDVRVQGLETLDVDPSQGVPVPLPAGGAVIHHVRCLHYAGPNRTNAPRYAYTYAVLRPSLPRTEPHDMPHVAVHKPAREERARQAETAASR